ncbi:transcription factor TFIIIB component B'' homolog isoform X3 [Denticeps clupeoides]|uniref:transcription factor TFIIIB component B'' homolog isoform X3 n=1 Tax=Denticeps clupeoides TaxID=299321 RepID=UPI0010A2B916|nr:transcription factor TFIIIB component B'' homolog isoform X3 [Denticeps clupeoides]
MIRRARISVRPNVRPAGRATAQSQDENASQQTPATVDLTQVSESAVETPLSESEQQTSSWTAARRNESVSHDSSAHAEAGNTRTGQQHAEGTSQSSGPQRRKRFSAIPNLAKLRAPPAATRASHPAPKSPVNSTAPAVSSYPCQALTVSLDSVKPSHRTSGKRRLSGGNKPTKVQPKAKTSPSVQIQAELGTEEPGNKESEKLDEMLTEQNKSCVAQPGAINPSKTPTQALDDPVAYEKDLPPQMKNPSTVSENMKDKRSPSLLSSSTSLKDPSDLIRLAKAEKLRQLLRKEMGNEKKKKAGCLNKARKTEVNSPKDHTRMTMRELIYYLPKTNPMKSYQEEDQQRAADTPHSPASPASPSPNLDDGTPEHSEQPEPLEEREEHEGEGGDTDVTEVDPGDQMPVPRVKVAEDGSLVVDEESLTVEVLRAKGPNLAEEMDPIFERGSTTTYSSFRKGTFTKPWSNQETDMFFLAISMVGTDFSMIGQLFPHRARSEIKNKFKKEEKINAWRIDKAFKDKRRLDLHFFSELLEKILAEEKKRKKGRKGKPASKSSILSVRNLLDYSSDYTAEDDVDSDMMEGEKENEDCLNELATVDENKQKELGRRSPTRQLKSRGGESTNGHGDVSSVQNDGSSKVARSSRVGKEWKQGPEEYEEEEHEFRAVQEQMLNKPTRSGRIPKFSQHLIQAGEEDDDDEEEQIYVPSKQSPALMQKAKVKPASRKKVFRRGQSKLVTLRASPTEEDEKEEVVEETLVQEVYHYPTEPEEHSQASAFIPLSLRSPPPVTMEVVETMEELDMSVNVPDVLGISQNAVCPDSTCKRRVGQVGTVPCDHQLDLLVDVIGIMATDNLEVTDESYTEAAQTLLTIGNPDLANHGLESHSTADVEVVVEGSSLDMQQEMVVPQPESDVVCSVTQMSTDFHVNASNATLNPGQNIGLPCCHFLPPVEDKVLFSEPDLSQPQGPSQTASEAKLNFADFDSAMRTTLQPLVSTQVNTTCAEDCADVYALERSGVENETIQGVSLDPASGLPVQNESNCDQPIYILSLTEILPSLTDSFTSDLCPGPRSNDSIEMSSSDVSHLLITDALVAVAEEEEKKEKGPVASEAGPSVQPESQSGAQGKRVDLSKSIIRGHERTRRAKLLVKPSLSGRRAAARNVSGKDAPPACRVKTTLEPKNSTTPISPPQPSYTNPTVASGALSSHEELTETPCAEKEDKDISQRELAKEAEQTCGATSHPQKRIRRAKLQVKPSLATQRAPSRNVTEKTGPEPEEAASEDRVQGIVGQEKDLGTVTMAMASESLNSYPNVTDDHCKEVFHLVISDALVPVLVEGNEGQDEVGVKPPTQPEVSGEEQEPPQKKTRRAKSQVKPSISARRSSAQRISAKEILCKSPLLVQPKSPTTSSSPARASGKESTSINLLSNTLNKEEEEEKTDHSEKVEHISLRKRKDASVVQLSEEADAEKMSGQEVLPQKRPRRAKLQVKPSLPTRHVTPRSVPKTEVPTLPVLNYIPTSNSSSPSVCTVSQLDVSLLEKGDRDGIVGNAFGAGEVQQATTSSPLSRPGRRPKAFLSFISNKREQGVAVTAQRIKHGPQISMSRQERTRLNTASDSKTERLVNASSFSNTHAISARVDPGTSRNAEQYIEMSVKHDPEEPTSVSEYFLNDIFTEVEEF